MSDVTATVETYLAMWNETDATRRAGQIRRAWADGGSYLDPLLEAEGHTALDRMVEAVHAQYPGHRFRRTSGIDVHHGRLRFEWELAAPDGTLTVAGLDVGELAADGRLARMIGFFGPVPADG
jgi:hypothetical protein